MPAIGNSCSICGKQLEAQVCLTCKGSGQVRAGLLGRRPCQVCGGTGTVHLCPDGAQHLLAKRSKLGAFTVKPKGGIPPVARQTCPICRGTKGIRLPMTGQAGPCPRCKGKGWV